jgi:hypothetical protein
MRYIMKPRWVFLIYISSVNAFLSAAIMAREDAGLAMRALLQVRALPDIVALGIRRVGRHTKRSLGVIVGGAVVPPILGSVADLRGTALAMLVLVCWFAVTWSYALCINFVPGCRDLLPLAALVSALWWRMRRWGRLIRRRCRLRFLVGCGGLDCAFRKGDEGVVVWRRIVIKTKERRFELQREGV